MKILVIGGSYFLGRVFVTLAAAQHEVTVVNRGSQPLTGINVTEIRGDRHDASVWNKITGDIDVLVDFCAYRPGDIRTVAEHLAASVKQYIFISTVDVYAHGKQDLGLADLGTNGPWEEDAAYETVSFPGEAGEYIAGKIALEQELLELCAQREIQPTILRPALLYGPLNYAPRETLFIRLMACDGILPVITGADGKFQFLYVKDGAEAVIKCLLNENAYGQAYNLCGDEIADYGILAKALRKGAQGLTGAADMPREAEISVEQAETQGFPLPFPASQAETLLCSNAKSKQQLGMDYISLEEGMSRTCRVFWDIFRRES